MKTLIEIEEEFNELKKEVKKLEALFVPHKHPFVRWIEKRKGALTRRGKKISYTYIIKVKEL